MPKMLAGVNSKVDGREIKTPDQEADATSVTSSRHNLGSLHLNSCSSKDMDIVTKQSKARPQTADNWYNLRLSKLALQNKAQKRKIA